MSLTGNLRLSAVYTHLYRVVMTQLTVEHRCTCFTSSLNMDITKLEERKHVYTSQLESATAKAIVINVARAHVHKGESVNNMWLFKHDN